MRSGSANVARQQSRQTDRAHHEHRGRNALARNVAEENDQSFRRGSADAVEIAAHLARRFEHRAEADAIRLFNGREIVRQHAHLDFAGDAQLAGDLLLHRVAVSLRLEQRSHARLHLEHLERFGEVIIGARLEAARLVLNFFERGEEHDRHFGGLRHLAQATANFIAIYARHHDVEQHEIGRRSRGELQCSFAVHREAEFVVGLQAFDEDVEVGLGVVH